MTPKAPETPEATSSGCRHKDHGLAGGCQFSADLRTGLAVTQVHVDQGDVGLIEQIDRVLPAGSHTANIEAGCDHGILDHHGDGVLIFDNEHFLERPRVFHVARSPEELERCSCKKAFLWGTRRPVFDFRWATFKESLNCHQKLPHPHPRKSFFANNAQ
jgi:hypothetical protein